MDLEVDVCISVHVLERSSICTRVLAAQTYSMSEWLLRPFSKEKEKKNKF